MLVVSSHLPPRSRVRLGAEEPGAAMSLVRGRAWDCTVGSWRAFVVGLAQGRETWSARKRQAAGLYTLPAGVDGTNTRYHARRSSGSKAAAAQAASRLAWILRTRATCAQAIISAAVPWLAWPCWQASCSSRRPPVSCHELREHCHHGAQQLPKITLPLPPTQSP
jgi:hypothetical protein